MTSHFIRCTVESPFENIFQAVSEAFGNVYAKDFVKADNLPAGLILGEKYFFRTTSSVAISVVIEARSSGITSVEMISSAGGADLLDISLGAHKSYVYKAKDHLIKTGCKLKVEGEIPYFGGIEPSYYTERKSRMEKQRKY